jgi:hypothetical protein
MTMNILLARLNLLLQLLLQGVRVDFAYSMVVILVITALFSTPLILGSIKNKVYVAVKEQVEKENNAREIAIQQADSSLKNGLGKLFLENLQNDANYKNKYQMVGNYQAVIMIEGPKEAQLQTMDTLVPHDPRTDSLQIKQQIPSNFGLFDVIISNGLGELLYGKEEWVKLWNTDSSQFTGKSLSLSVNDTPIEGKFQVVARQTSPGIKVYGSTQLGEALRKHSIGLGAKELGLPVVKDLVQYALPKFETQQCIVSFPQDSCTSDQQANIVKRLRADNYQIDDLEGSKTVFENIKQIQVTLTKTTESKGHVEIKPTKGDCEARLSHHLNACPTATATPNISVETTLISKSAEKPYSVTLASITARSYDLLPGLQKMKDQSGGGMTFENEGLLEKGIEIAVPYGVKLQIGEPLSLQMGTVATVPALVAAYYTCSKPISCPFYANAKMIFRLQNVADGMATFEPGRPPLFYPTEKSIQVDYDKVLVYANQVEEVETLHHQLQQQFSNYSVEYNRFAIDKLKRQDERLATLFGLTVILSVIFIIFAVGALAKINIDRRKRQMAQLFILGYSKLFVSALLICEYLLLTVFASLAAMGTGWVVFATARHYLQSSVETGSTEFNTIVNAMTLDIGAFGVVFVIVVFLTTVVAIFAAYLASKSDPVTLLD